MKLMILLEIKCPQLSKPEATVARNQNSIGDRMKKKILGETRLSRGSSSPPARQTSLFQLQQSQRVRAQLVPVEIRNTLDFFSKLFKYKIIFCISNMYFKYMNLRYCPSLAILLQWNAQDTLILFFRFLLGLIHLIFYIYLYVWFLWVWMLMDIFAFLWYVWFRCMLHAMTNVFFYSILIANYECTLVIDQGCPILALKTYLPAEFSSNPDQTHLQLSSDPSDPN